MVEIVLSQSAISTCNTSTAHHLSSLYDIVLCLFAQLLKLGLLLAAELLLLLLHPVEFPQLLVAPFSQVPQFVVQSQLFHIRTNALP